MLSYTALAALPLGDPPAVSAALPPGKAHAPSQTNRRNRKLPEIQGDENPGAAPAACSLATLTNTAAPPTTTKGVRHFWKVKQGPYATRAARNKARGNA